MSELRVFDEIETIFNKVGYNIKRAVYGNGEIEIIAKSNVKPVIFPKLNRTINDIEALRKV